jgi:hypothetical protein
MHGEIKEPPSVVLYVLALTRVFATSTIWPCWHESQKLKDFRQRHSRRQPYQRFRQFPSVGMARSRACWRMIGRLDCKQHLTQNRATADRPVTQLPIRSIRRRFRQSAALQMYGAFFESESR